MGLFDLGKRIWDVTKEQGKDLWQGVEPELGDFSTPAWERVKSRVREHGSEWRQKVRVETQGWIEDELRHQQINWRTLLGRDPELERAYALLELPYGTEVAVVKQRWRSLLKESHPDRFMSDPEQAEIATQRSQYLTAAYHQITKAFDEGRLA